MDGGGKRLPAGLKLAIEKAELAALLEEALHGDGLALLGFQPFIECAKALQHGEVRTAGESLLAGGDDAALDGLITGDPCRSPGQARPSPRG